MRLKEEKPSARVNKAGGSGAVVSAGLPRLTRFRGPSRKSESGVELQVAATFIPWRPSLLQPGDSTGLGSLTEEDTPAA